MARYSLWIVAMAVVAFVSVLPPAALAGGWSTVTPDALPGDMVAGEQFTVGFTVLQHGVTPRSDLQPIVKLTDPAGVNRQAVHAVKEGGPGHYVAQITLDQPGTWQWVVDAFEGDHVMAPLTVKPAAVMPVSVQPAGELAVSALQPGWLQLATAISLALLAIAAIAGSRSRWRSRSGNVGQGVGR